jgi:hypothetical protein
MTPPIAWIGFGSANPTLYPAGNAVTSYVDWALQTGPRLKRHGITRVFLHNPGGQHFTLTRLGDWRDMRVDQWEISERRRYPFANRFDFRTAVGILEEHGVTEVIVYVGTPTQLLDPVNELPVVLKAFTDCGPIVSFGFDAMFEDGHGEKWQDLWAKDSPYRTALANLRKKHKVYAEARLHPAQLKAELGKLVNGTIAVAEDDAAQFPDLAGQPGETIRATRAGNHSGEWPEADLWPFSLTRLYRSEFNWGPLMDKGAK